MPPIAAVTAGCGVRAVPRPQPRHVLRADGVAADRFDYLYTPEELGEWEGTVRDLADAADETYVMFNNCRYDYAPRNAAEMAEILSDLVEPLPDGDLPGHHEEQTLF